MQLFNYQSRNSQNNALNSIFQPFFFHPNLNRRKHNPRYNQSPEQLKASYFLFNNDIKNKNNINNINLLKSGNNINYNNINIIVDSYDVNNLIINNYDIKKNVDTIIKSNSDKNSIHSSENSSCVKEGDKSRQNNSKSMAKNTITTSNNISKSIMTIASLIMNGNSKIKNNNKDINNYRNNNYLNQNYDYKNNFNKIAKNDLGIIDEGFNLLNEFDDNISNFLKILKLIKINKDLDIILNKRKIQNLNSKKRLEISNNETKNSIKNIIDEYFNVLSSLFPKINKFSYNNNNNDDYFAYNYFSFKIINDIFYKSIKIQICLFSWLYFILSKLNDIEITNIINEFFYIRIKDISYILIIIFNKFIKEEFNLKYSDKEIP